MNKRTKESCDQYKPLMMGLLDNELTADEARSVNDHLTRCDGCRTEYAELKETSGKIAAISFSETSDNELRKLWKSPYSRLARGSGIFLVLAGWLALVGYALYGAIRATETVTFPHFAVAAVLLGTVVLLITVIRDRIKTYKTDPYKEVDL